MGWDGFDCIFFWEVFILSFLISVSASWDWCWLLFLFFWLVFLLVLLHYVSFNLVVQFSRGTT